MLDPRHVAQAMGRSRTMNDTRFTIYKSQVAGGQVPAGAAGGLCDIKKHPLTRQLYVRNCDCKVAGNLSSIYQTLVSLFNLSQVRSSPVPTSAFIPLTWPTLADPGIAAGHSDDAFMPPRDRNRSLLSQDSFYHCGEIVNVFIEKMEMTIMDKVPSPTLQ